MLVAKYADDVPLHRQGVIDAREDVELDGELLASWGLSQRAAAALGRVTVPPRRCAVAWTAPICPAWATCAWCKGADWRFADQGWEGRRQSGA